MSSQFLVENPWKISTINQSINQGMHLQVEEERKGGSMKLNGLTV